MSTTQGQPPNTAEQIDVVWSWVVDLASSDDRSFGLAPASSPMLSAPRKQSTRMLISKGQLQRFPPSCLRFLPAQLGEDGESNIAAVVRGVKTWDVRPKRAVPGRTITMAITITTNTIINAIA